VKFRCEMCNVEISIPVHNNDCKKYYKIKISKLLKKTFYEKEKNKTFYNF
jgi:hypothetical protein